ncbi:MAG TPA: 7-carboxy-7-deazaguanine synthase [Burkholderiaceae bacterium]|nr:7-carboxy-7-deazaguanine synthase [Burkholderiaceae bacterium]
MTYAVKEIFYTLQGEGAQSGRPAVFCRFAGCNLWSGLERDRESAICTFCDTDFVGTDGAGGGKFTSAKALVDALQAHWPHEASGHNGHVRPFVVCTGGEPLLQLDAALLAALHARGWEVAVETNGTQPAPPGIDWICVSPKAGTRILVQHGNELKLVYPQPGLAPESFAQMDFAYFFLQPMDGPALQENTQLALAYCKAHPQWRLSIQTHKILGIA